ncbi:hypothetical protein TWF569_000166 [Orbilia oligospora]|uniref:Ubiquitin 3 binding protein But2 C-terminal domain-containing protein n=1 Tax=Orbilia oligospora TaxID=2813651 RepID=A0A7C8P253_ORBOL|nr:hypothetical protein TWF102_003026 [Orbilia oligospora]KAF3109338.1 hypothetical protein TWF103_005213 [Orbilia oligospora]KAF3147274.1 hypothetical protein TWF703_000114 [Orbilia oligospora]KAF3150507.1 hypothetical protein TWF594_009151 [Orbilia oligospora]KAF3157601.1 hypothetical protein TWF569_000166 [Orbilia oligospora]
MKYAISLVGLLAAAGAQADDCPENNCVRAVIAAAFPNRPTASDCSSFLSATVTPVVSQTSWVKTTSTTTTTAETRTTTIKLGDPTPDLPTETSSISYPYGAPAPTQKRRRRAFGKVKRDDPIPPSPIPDGLVPEVPPLATEITITPTSLPTYAAAACVPFTSKGIARSPASRFSHACSCKGFTTATRRETTSTHTTSYIVTTAITTFTPLSWVIATSFKLHFTGSAFSGSYVGTSTGGTGSSTVFIRPTPLAQAVDFVIHPDRKPSFPAPPSAIGGSPSQPDDDAGRRITCNGGLLTVKESANGGNQRFFKVISDGNPVSLPEGHFPVLCKINPSDNIFTCQGEGTTAAVVDFGFVDSVPANPLMRIYGADFTYVTGGPYIKKDKIELKAV